VSGYACTSGFDDIAYVHALLDDLVATFAFDEGAVHHVYPGCDGGGDVELYEVVGGGHTWPGGFQHFPEMRVGRTSRDVDASALMWCFLSAHRR
jgi:poly(3-hydroxybutyrate) depolymerase